MNGVSLFYLTDVNGSTRVMDRNPTRDDLIYARRVVRLDPDGQRVVVKDNRS